MNLQPARCRTLFGERAVILGDPHLVRMVMESEDRVGAVAHLKVPTLTNAFLRDGARFGKVSDPLAIH